MLRGARGVMRNGRAPLGRHLHHHPRVVLCVNPAAGSRKTAVGSYWSFKPLSSHKAKWTTLVFEASRYLEGNEVALSQKLSASYRWKS